MNIFGKYVRMTITKKLMGALIIVTLSLATIIPIISIYSFSAFYLESLRSEAAHLATTIASSIKTRLQPLFNKNTTTEFDFYSHFEQALKNTKLEHVYILLKINDEYLAYITDVSIKGGDVNEVPKFMDVKPISQFNKGIRDVLQSSDPLFSTSDSNITKIKDSNSLGGYAPIFYDGEVAAVVGAEIHVENIVNSIGKYMLTIIIAVIILQIMSILVGLMFVKKIILNPLNNIKRVAKLIAIRELDFDMPITGEDEFSDIAAVINDSVKPALTELKEKDTRIQESLSYASRIQRNLLPEYSKICKAFSDFSIIYLPKETVSGDFYWLEQFDSGTVLIVGDCTGHGVPGAMMTVMVNAILPHVVRENICSQPNEIICRLDSRLARNIAQSQLEDSEIHDGLDAVVMFIDNDLNATVSSTNMSLIIKNNATFKTIKGQRLPIGEGKLEDPSKIATYFIPYNPQDSFFIASDGLADQICEDTKLPFGNMGLKRTLKSFSGFEHIDMETANQIIYTEFIKRMGNQQQRDDITLFSFKLGER